MLTRNEIFGFPFNEKYKKAVAYFSMAAQNGYSTTANTAAQFETVALLAGTTAVPTGFTASPFGGAQTLYYMRDLQRLFTFNVTALTGTIVAGATFSNNGVTFTVNQAYAAGVTSIVAATPAGWNGTLPTASGTLALVANTGTQTAITFSSNTAGSWYFNLSATSTGVLIAPTSASAALTMVRGAGQSSTHSLLKTGTQSTALTGTILQAHSFGAAVPVSVPASAALNNADCLFISTSTNLYMGKVSDLVDGSVSFASLTGVNALGTTTDIVTPTIAFARYDGTIDRWVYVTNTSKFIMKPHQNNMISKIFGSPNIDYFEAQNPVSVQNGLAAIVSLNVVAGWAFITGSTTGQRGVVACDLRADDYFGFSYIISKVMKVPAGSLLRFFTTDEAYSLFTGDAIFYVRSGATATDPIFTTDLTSGWTQFQPYQDQGAVAIGPYFQVKIGSQILQDNSSCSPPQIGDVVVVYDSPGSIDDHWAWVGERTTQSGVSPMKVSTRLMYAHETTPSKFKLIGYDDSGNVVQTIDSSITPSAFAQSANNGTSYTTFTSMAAFMSGFNVAGGTTELAITISSPPAIPFVTWSFKYE